MKGWQQKPDAFRGFIVSRKGAGKCKKNGDWCQVHDRAKSQCFKAEPKLRQKRAGMYRAKYGTEPPHMEEVRKKRASP
jgi:hypothetical protein